MPAVTVWLDPGKTTGLASWDSRNDSFTSIQASDLVTVGNWIEMLILVNDSEMAEDSDDNDDDDGTGLRIEIGWEKFVTTPGTVRHGGKPDWSLEVIGVARYLAVKHGLSILPPQMSSMMAIATDERLRLVGWYRPGKQHANDAARHLFRYLVVTGRLPADLHRKAFPLTGEPEEKRGGNR